MNKVGKTIQKFFTYGTLRSGSDLPEEMKHLLINDNYKLTFYNAYLTHCKLFLDENNKYPILRYNKEEYDENQIVKGNIIESTNFEETLKNFDEWEDYPKLYDRIVVEAINIDKNNEKEEVILYIRDLDMIYLNDLPYDDYLEYLKCKKYLK